MKIEYKIIIVTFLALFSFLFLDVLIDSHFNKTSFLQELAFEERGMVFRLLSSAYFIVFGISIALAFKRQKKIKEALAASEEKYRALVESTEDSIYVLDRNCRYLFINKTHLSRLGISGNNYPGSSYSEYHSQEKQAEFLRIVEEVFKTGKSARHEHKGEKGDDFFLLTLSPVKNPAGDVTAVTVVSKNITEIKRMEEQLREFSFEDELTGLYNRRGFLTLANQHIKIANRMKTKICMLYADLDNLKFINDTFGHSEGDIAITVAATLIKDTFRESDIIARIGGDEFVVIPIGNTEGSAAATIISRLQKNIDAFNARTQKKYVISLSSGISCYDPENPSSLEGLLMQADKSMYAQKMQKRLSDKH